MAFWVSTLGAVRSGRCLRTAGGEPGELLDVLESWRPTVLVAPTALARRVVRNARSTGRDLSALDTLVVNATGATAEHIESLCADLAACGADRVRVARAPPICAPCSDQTGAESIAYPRLGPRTLRRLNVLARMDDQFIVGSPGCPQSEVSRSIG